MRGNGVDHHPVAVVKVEMVVSHVPWKISRMCSPFLSRGRSITCQVKSAKMYSTHLPQGSSVAVPCADGTDVFLIDSS